MEKVRLHKILGLNFDNRSIKAKAEIIMSTIRCPAQTKWGSDQGNLHRIHKMIILSTIRYGEESKSVLKNLKPTHNRGIRLPLGVFAVYRTENALFKAGV
jgi:hypothetical protein